MEELRCCALVCRASMPTQKRLDRLEPRRFEPRVTDPLEPRVSGLCAASDVLARVSDTHAVLSQTQRGPLELLGTVSHGA